MKERVNNYIKVLKGFQYMEMYTRALGDHEDYEECINGDYKYKVARSENEKFIIYSFLRDAIYNPYYTKFNHYQALIKSLYVHKSKDMIILKVPILNIYGHNSYNNNILRYFRYLCKRYNLKHVKYTNSKFADLSNNTYDNEYRYIKLLLTEDISGEDIIEILNILDFINVSVKTNRITVWDTMASIARNIVYNT